MSEDVVVVALIVKFFTFTVFPKSSAFAVTDKSAVLLKVEPKLTLPPVVEVEIVRLLFAVTGFVKLKFSLAEI